MTQASGSDARAGQKGIRSPERSLKANVAWTGAGNAVYALCQWGMVAVLARLGDAGLVGLYALGIAVATPVLMLAQLNLRSVLATDVQGRHRFGEYRDLRLLALLAAMVAITGLALAGGDRTVILLTGVMLAVEWISDIYFGLLQQHEQMDRISVSMMLRGLLSLAALAAAMALTGSLSLGLVVVIAVRLAILGLYDATRAVRHLAPAGGDAPRWPVRRAALADIFRTAFPLGVVLMIGALTTNVPRYFIAHYLDASALGIFAALASLTNAGGMVMNSVGQAATPRLARLYAGGRLGEFQHLTLKLAAGGAALGLAGAGLSWLAGRWIAGALYGPEYAARTDVLIALSVALAAGFVAMVLGYAITAARRFKEQMPLQASALAACTGAAVWLVPAYGLLGAAAAWGAGQTVQALGEWLVLRSAVRVGPETVLAHEAPEGVTQ